jgi:large subunit ribosomal protein L21
MEKYAIIETGGKQYKVKEQDTILVERIAPVENNQVVFDKVLLISNNGDVKIGTPYIENAKVTANVIGEEKAKKVIIFKYRRRKSSKTKKGHRQIYTKVKIEKIVEG